MEVTNIKEEAEERSFERNICNEPQSGSNERRSQYYMLVRAINICRFRVLSISGCYSREYTAIELGIYSGGGKMDNIPISMS